MHRVIFWMESSVTNVLNFVRRIHFLVNFQVFYSPFSQIIIKSILNAFLLLLGFLKPFFFILDQFLFLEILFNLYVVTFRIFIIHQFIQIPDFFIRTSQRACFSLVILVILIALVEFWRKKMAKTDTAAHMLFFDTHAWKRGKINVKITKN